MKNIQLRKAISDEGTPAVPRYVVPDEMDVVDSPVEPVKTELAKSPDSDKGNNGNG